MANFSRALRLTDFGHYTAIAHTVFGSDQGLDNGNGGLSVRTRPSTIHQTIQKVFAFALQGLIELNAGACSAAIDSQGFILHEAAF